jgi:hypothetical protein
MILQAPLAMTSEKRTHPHPLPAAIVKGKPPAKNAP